MASILSSLHNTQVSFSQVSQAKSPGESRALLVFILSSYMMEKYRNESFGAALTHVKKPV